MESGLRIVRCCAPVWASGTERIERTLSVSYALGGGSFQGVSGCIDVLKVELGEADGDVDPGCGIRSFGGGLVGLQTVRVSFGDKCLVTELGQSLGC